MYHNLSGQLGGDENQAISTEQATATGALQHIYSHACSTCFYLINERGGQKTYFLSDMTYIYSMWLI